MAAFNMFHAFPQHLCEGVHNLTGATPNTLKVYLSNAAPDVTVAANLAVKGSGPAEISSTTNNYSAQTIAVTGTNTAGVFKISATAAANVVFTQSGASDIGPFRYAILYNDTPTTPYADPLIGYWDKATTVQLTSGETFTVDFDDTNGILQITHT